MKIIKTAVEGRTIARYRKGRLTWTCKICNCFYCATFHNGKQSATTYYSTDKNEVNDLIKKEIANGFRREM